MKKKIYTRYETEQQQRNAMQKGSNVTTKFEQVEITG